TRCYRDWSSDVCSSDLLRRGEHAERVHPAQLRRLDLEITRQLCADNSQRGLQPGTRIARAAYDLQRFTLPRRDSTHLELVGLRRSEERRVGKGCRSRWG